METALRVHEELKESPAGWGKMLYLPLEIVRLEMRMTTPRVKPAVSYLQERRAVLAACLRLVDLGYLLSTYGNVSVRVPDGLIITPTRVSYDSLAPEDLALVSLDGKVLEGRRSPSSEMHTHRRIYQERPDIGAVVHTHSLHATAVSSMHHTIPVLAEEQAHLVGGEIACTRYVLGVDHLGLAEEVVKVMGHRNAVLMANHGTLSCGRTLEEALVTCRITERAAQMYLLARAAGGPVPMSAENVAIERDHFLYKYGAPEQASPGSPPA